ncbi:MAG: hypothetical protein KIT82_19705 [Bradyrhizobium sp.]|nr:hypothetical protein [Bradyrhizobium sp.]
MADLLGRSFLECDLLVVKDPRACRLVPLWHDLLADLEADLLAVIPLRSPGEVAKSLAARSGTPLDVAVALWLRHVIDAESATRQVNRAIVWYDDLLTDPVATADKIARQLDVVWPNQPESVRAEIGSFISPGLRHHAEKAAPLPGTLSPLAARVAALMEQLAAGAYHPAALAELDEIGAALDRATGVIRPHVPLDVV